MSDPKQWRTSIRHPKAKFTDEQVREIRRCGTSKDWAVKYGVAEQTIYAIRARKTYKNVV